MLLTQITDLSQSANKIYSSFFLRTESSRDWDDFGYVQGTGAEICFQDMI